MKRVLLTGATGFIGRHCIPFLLDRGYEVHAISSRQVSLSSPPLNWHQVDLLKPAAVAALVSEVKPTHLLHFAWIVEPGVYWTSLDNFRWVQASLHLLQTFVEHGGQRITLTGSCAEYDWQYGYCSEDVTPTHPTTVYGICKNSLRTMMESFAQQAKISAAWGRIFFLYGPHEDERRLISSAMKSLLQDRSIQCTDGSQIRDLLHVEDVASAFVALLNSEVRGPVNIASGQPVALKAAMHRIGQLTQRAHLIELGARPTPPHEPPLLVADIRKLRDKVGWKPKYNLETGLEDTLAWWQSHLTAHSNTASMLQNSGRG